MHKSRLAQRILLVPLCIISSYVKRCSPLQDCVTKIGLYILNKVTGRNRTGPPCSVGRPTAHAPDGRPARPPAALQTTTDDRRQRAKPYWPIRRASNKTGHYHIIRDDYSMLCRLSFLCDIQDLAIVNVLTFQRG